MSQLVSTVPGAVSSLLSHFDTVAANNPSLKPLVIYGAPVGGLTATTKNLLQVSGVHQVQREWKTLGALGSAGGNPTATEIFDIDCVVRSWVAGANERANQLQSLTNAWTLLDAIVVQLFNDPTAGGAIGPPGSWSVGPAVATQEALKDGWSTDIDFGVTVANVRISWT